MSVRAGDQSRHQHGQRQQPGAAGAVASCRPRCSAAASRSQAASAAILDVPAVLQRGRQARPAVHQQLRHHQRAGPPGARRPASATRSSSAGSTIRCASGSTSERLVSLNMSRRPDIIDGHPLRRTCRQRSGASAPGPTSDATQFQLNVQTQGRLVTPEQFGAHRYPRQPGRLGAAPVATSRASNWAPPIRTPKAGLNGNPAVSHRALSRAGRQRGADLGARQGRAG